jgi:hypothetical protein
MWGSQSGNFIDVFNKIEDKEVNYQIIISRFISTLTRSQQTEFVSVLTNIDMLYLTMDGDCQNNKPCCKLPISFANLRRMYTDGDCAITKHLPIPECTMYEDHSFVSITDCIADFFLCNKLYIATINDWDNIINADKSLNEMTIFCGNHINNIINDAKNRINNGNFDDTYPVVPLFLKFWSDDFDPNKSIKANRQSVWIKTCTIFVMTLTGEQIKKTYPISLTKKGTNHEAVECKINDELTKLRSGNLWVMYSRYHNSPIYVHADLYCVMNDQPERRGNLQLAHGNSSIHARMGLILDCKQVKNIIRSCPHCSESIRKEVEDYHINVFTYQKGNIDHLQYSWRKKLQ